MVEYLVHFVDALHGKPWAIPVFVVVYAIVCLTGPITPFPIMAGVLFGIWEGFALSLLAEVLGCSGAFFIGRIFEQRVLEHRLGARYKNFLSAMEKDGFRAVLAMRLLGLPPFVLLNYLAGVSGVTWRAYLSATFLGVIPWTVVMTYFSRLFWGILVDQGIGGFHRALMSRFKEFVIGGALVGVFLLVQWFWKRRKKRSVQREGLSE